MQDNKKLQDNKAIPKNKKKQEEKNGFTNGKDGVTMKALKRPTGR